MIELGAIIDRLGLIIKNKSTDWLADQVAVYTLLHTHNASAVSLFTSDPTGVKAYVPGDVLLLDTPGWTFNSTGTANYQDADTILFANSATDTIQRYTLSTQEWSDEISPATGTKILGDSTSHFWCNRGIFHKTTSGVAWYSYRLGSSGSYYYHSVQYSNDDFSSITTVTTSDVPSGYRYVGSYASGDILYVAYVYSTAAISPGFEKNDIKIISYNLSTNTSSVSSTTSVPYILRDYAIGMFQNYLLIYHTYKQKTGYFLIDITGSDGYWYYIDPTFFNLFYPDQAIPFNPKPYDFILRATPSLMDVKIFSNKIYFLFLLEDSYKSVTKLFSYVMETV